MTSGKLNTLLFLSGWVCAGAMSVALSLSMSGSAKADFKHCYWNSANLPFSMEAPEYLSETTDEYALAQTFVLLEMNAPHLAWQSACDLIDAKDMAEARIAYRGMGCTENSSLGKMIEGLAHGGEYFSIHSSQIKYLIENYPNETRKVCSLIDQDPACFKLGLTGDEEVEDRARKAHPECFGAARSNAKQASDIVRLLMAENDEKMDALLDEFIRITDQNDADKN